MDVHLQRDLYIGMTQNFGQRFDVHTAVDAACRKRMTQNMEISVGDTQLFQKFLKTILHCPRLHMLVTAGKQVVIFTCPEGTQHGKHFRRQRNCPLGVVRFWRLNDQFRASTVVDSIGRAPDMEQTICEINIRPAQGADLAQSDTRFQT